MLYHLIASKSTKLKHFHVSHRNGFPPLSKLSTDILLFFPCQNTFLTVSVENIHHLHQTTLSEMRKQSDWEHVAHTGQLDQSINTTFLAKGDLESLMNHDR